MSRTPPGRPAATRATLPPAMSINRVVVYAPSFASPWPMAIGVLAVVVSLVLVGVGVSIGEPTVLVPPWLALPLPQAEFAVIGWIGYTLTPVIPICSLVIDRVLQGRALANAQFIPRPAYGLVLKVAAALGIVVSMWHIITIAVPVVELVQGLDQ